jgi:hypothetical protein
MEYFIDELTPEEKEALLDDLTPEEMKFIEALLDNLTPEKLKEIEASLVKKIDNEMLRQDMLDYALQKYEIAFEAVEYVPSARGFNDGMLETRLALRDPGTGMIVNVWERNGTPKKFYDDYQHAVASHMAEDLINYGDVDGMQYAKTYIAVRDFDSNKLSTLLDKDNVLHVGGVICIAGPSTQERLDQLYSIYTALQATGYKRCFLEAAFTGGGTEFEAHVRNCIFKERKRWENIGDTHETLSVREAGLTKDEFVQQLKQPNTEIGSDANV